MDGVAKCKFPECDRPASEGSFALCPEHRRLLIDDPGEFRRLWGALDPRSATREPPPWAQ
jgi:hypothetical protein